jgi:hypothetical protein
MAEACDVHRNSFDNWVEVHPEFLEALQRAKQKAQAWFEREGRFGLKAERFNAPLWQKQMSARHREEYTERRENDHISSDGSMSPVGEVPASERLSTLLDSMKPKGEDK